MPVEMIGLLFALAAEPRPPSGTDAEVSLELLEYLGEMDTAPSWVRDDTTPSTQTRKPVPPATEPTRKRGSGERRP